MGQLACMQYSNPVEARGWVPWASCIRGNFLVFDLVTVIYLFIYCTWISTKTTVCYQLSKKKKNETICAQREGQKPSVYVMEDDQQHESPFEVPINDFPSCEMQFCRASFFENLKKSEQALWLTKLARNRDFALGKWILILQQFWVMMTFKSCSVLLQLFS